MMSFLQQHTQWTEVYAIMVRIREKGFQVLLVGGCVRDALMNKVPYDLDLASNADPDEIEKIFPEALPVGKAFGTMVIPFDGGRVEVTRFRKDMDYRDGRHPDRVEFSSVREDAQRRDFTMNAMYFDPFNGEFFDFFGGREDIKRKMIRAVGDPDERFTEDHLRILRAVRFQAQLGFEIEEKTLEAVVRHAHLLKKVKAERTLREWEKLLGGAYQGPAFEVLGQSDLMGFLLPENGENFERSLYVNWSRDCLEFRWLLLFLCVRNLKAPKLRAWLLQLKLDRKRQTLILNGVRAFDAVCGKEVTLGKKLIAMGSLPKMVLHNISSATDPGGKILNEGFMNVLKDYRERLDIHGELPKPLLTPDDLQSLGVSRGPKFGQWLKDAYAHQLEENVGDKRDLIIWLKKSPKSQGNKAY